MKKQSSSQAGGSEVRIFYESKLMQDNSKSRHGRQNFKTHNGDRYAEGLSEDQESAILASSSMATEPALVDHKAI